MPVKLKDEFVSNENKHFELKFGRTIASSLSGFLAGIVVTIIVILAFFDLSLKLVN